jgi:hypothetical protein
MAFCATLYTGAGIRALTKNPHHGRFPRARRDANGSRVVQTTHPSVLDEAWTTLPFTSHILRWCTALLSPIGERGDELAAELWDVGDDAAPDEVGGGRETLGHVSDDPLS